VGFEAAKFYSKEFLRNNPDLNVCNMKKIEEIKNKLEELKPILKEKYNVANIGFFGSYVRGQEKRSSDLDVLVELSEPIGLFKFIELEDFLSEILGVKVDLVMKETLKQRIKDRILNEAVYV